MDNKTFLPFVLPIIVTALLLYDQVRDRRRK